ncbi:MAG: efflux RND transporter permease subunit, partial [Acidobacteriota bacterium]
EFGTVKGLHRMASVSVSGMSRTALWFKQGTDMDVAYREVRDRIERARTQFPSDIDHTFIRKEDVSGIPVYAIGIAIDPEIQNPFDLIKYDVIRPLERIDGVASVGTFGLEEKEILIEVDRRRANAAGLNIYQLGQLLGDDNFTMASGTVYDGPRKLLLRSVASYDSVEALRNRLVAPSVRLRDVARVKYEEPDVKYRARVNSKPAVALHVLKESEANTREVCLAVHAAIEKIRQNPRLTGMEITGFFNQGDVIDDALGTLKNSGLIGGFLACIVLFMFMRRLRLTLIVAFSIPLSLVIALTVMYFSGETLNLLTLIGLMLCVGLLVDNSVVVAENIHRLHRQGMGRRLACIDGSSEVALAITMSTLTTIVVFMPVALVEGPAQFFLMRLAIPVAVAVAASLMVALVFIPLCVYLTLPTGLSVAAPGLWRRAHRRLNGVLRWVYEMSFGRLNAFYNSVTAWFLGRRFELVLMLLAVFIGTFAATRSVKNVGQQEDERAQFEINVSVPDNYTFEETEAWFHAAEKVLAKHKDAMGLSGWFVFHRKKFGQMQAWFDPERKSTITAKEGTKLVLDELPKRPGIELFTGEDEQQEGARNAGLYAIFLRGEDVDLVESVAKQLEETLVKVDGVLGVKKTSDETPNELGLIVDRDRAQRVGVNPQVVAGVVGYALRGQALPRFHKEGHEIPVRVRFRKEDRESLTELSSFLVPIGNGRVLPLSALTSTSYLDSARAIVRRNKQIGRTITLELVEGKAEETRARLARLQASMDLPEGVSFGSNMQQQQLDDDFAGLTFAMVLSIVFIYLLMGFLFESFILPFSILLTIPLSIIGVRWIHLLTGRDIDFLGVVAMVLLVGVVVNNGIVLVDYINRLRNQGMNRRQAVLRATNLRFRPIMMTAITTIGGMIPLALAGANSIGLSYTSFSLTLIGGMSTATILTLLVVPVFYTLFDDMKMTVMGTLKDASPSLLPLGAETAQRGTSLRRGYGHSDPTAIPRVEAGMRRPPR